MLVNIFRDIYVDIVEINYIYISDMGVVFTHYLEIPNFHKNPKPSLM